MIHEHICPDGSRVLIVEVPLNFRNPFYSVDSSGKSLCWPEEALNQEYEGDDEGQIDLPPGNWQPPVLPESLSDEEAARIVEKFESDIKFTDRAYNNYVFTLDSEFAYSTEKEYLSSLIRSLVTNPNCKTVLILEKK